MLSRFTNKGFGGCSNLHLVHNRHLRAIFCCFDFYYNYLPRKMKVLNSSVCMSHRLFRSATFSHFKKYQTVIPSKKSDKYALAYLICAREYNSVNVEDLPVVSVSEIKKTLKINGIAFEEGYTCLVTDCLACMKPDCGKVFINKTTGYFICYKCRHAGTWDLFEKLLQHKKKKTKLTKTQIDVLMKDSEIIKEVNNLWSQVERDTELLGSLSEEAILDILSEYNFSNISAAALEFLEIRVDKERSKLYIPLQDVEGQKAGFKILSRETKKTETLPKKGCGGIMCSRVARGVKQDAAVIVPEVADALALATHRIGYQIICLPHGLSSLPQQVLPALERYSKLVLWFGNDIVSWDVARNFAKKLGEKRCYFVRPTEKQPSPYVALLMKMDLKAIINGAQPIWHQAITTFSSLREDVLSELQNNDKVEGVKWTRFPALNRILKGHRRGEFTVLTGPTGSGKTTFISEYSLDLAMQGVNTLWGSFEIRNARLARTMLQQMAEMPLSENLDKFDTLADTFERLPIYFMNFHGQQSIKLVMEAVEHAAYVHDIAHLIIDNVQFMMGVSDESRHMDRFWKQDTIIANFRSFATKKNCHVTLVIHPRKENNVEDLTISSVFGGAKATQEADNILIIQDKRLTSVRGKKYLQVAKNRYSGDLGVMPLEFHKESLSYGQRKKKTPSEKGQPAADTQ